MAQPVARDDDANDLLKEARENWTRAYEREEQNIDAAYEDLAFLAGDQWDSKAKQDRVDEGRPILTINRLPQFVHQVTGDIRQMKPSLKFVPVDSEADTKVADLYGGLARYIENRSYANAVYNRAADSFVSCGIGAWRVQTEYADDSTFEQEIRIGPIEDPVMVLFDPDAILPTKEDGKFCFVPIDMSRAAFEQKYPEVTATDFDGLDWKHKTDWVADDYIRVAEYWVKKPSKRKLAYLPNGSVADVTDADQSVLGYYLAQGARVEQRDSYKVVRYLITAANVLEGPQEWPGRLIPIVPVVGEEIRIGRKVVRYGLVRNAKDPQRMYNYFRSTQTESMALQPKAPFIVTVKNVQKHQDVWNQAGSKNWPYLPYEPDKENGGAPPQRAAPPVASQGLSEGVALAAEDLKAVTGIYDASLGAKSNETSGKAIMARQREGDVGSYVYIDNFARAIQHTGRIIADLIPKVYDTQRMIRIMGEDGKVDILEINKTAGIGPDGQPQFMNDVTVGTYDVVAIAGPNYTTRREEARESMIDFMRAAPNVAPLILDLVAKSQDWPLADDIAKRVRATIPPQVLMAEELEKQGVPAEEAQAMMAQQQQQPPPPDPEKVAKAQGQMQKNELEMVSGRMKLEHQQGMNEMEAQSKMMDAANAALDLQIKTARLEQMNNQETP